MILVSLTEFKKDLSMLSSLVPSEVEYMDKRIFPDGEILLKARNPEKFKGSDVVLYFKLYPNQNKRLIELFQALDIISDYFPRSLVLIIPYLIYARQDKRFREGECISLKTLLKALSLFKIDKLISLDVHNPKAVEKYSNFDFVNLTALIDIAKYVKDRLFVGEDMILVSPDIGGIDRVRMVSKELNLDYICLEKRRNRETGEISFKKARLDLRDLNVLVLDDIIATGGTIVGAGRILAESGAKKVVAGATHLLLLGSAGEKILNSGYSSIVGSNTIDTPYSMVRIEPMLARTLKK